MEDLAAEEHDSLSLANQNTGLSPCGLMEAPLHHRFYVILILFWSLDMADDSPRGQSTSYLLRNQWR